MKENVEEVVLELEHLIWQVCDATETLDNKLISEAQSKLDIFLESLPYGNSEIKDALMEHVDIFGWPELILSVYNKCTYLITKEEYEYCQEQWPDQKQKICEDIERRFK